MKIETIKILLVDDDQDVLFEMQDILKRRGYDVCAAVNSDEAMETFLRERPHICFLDIAMPLSRLDGIGVLQEIRKIDKACFCIMLTASIDKKNWDLAHAFGANRYLIKPFDFRDLIQLVRDLSHVIRGEEI